MNCPGVFPAGHHSQPWESSILGNLGRGFTRGPAGVLTEEIFICKRMARMEHVEMLVLPWGNYNAGTLTLYAIDNTKPCENDMFQSYLAFLV